MAAFTFYTRVKIAIVAPVATAAAITVGSIVWVIFKPKKGRKRKRFVDIHHAKHRGSHGSQIKEGLWDAAPLVLFFLDLVYPLVTRTLCSFFSCRHLGNDNYWLEEDYGVKSVKILQHTFSDRTRCIAQLRPGSSFLCNAPQFHDRCYDTEYNEWIPWMWLSACIYAFGLPTLFMFLLKHYMHRGKAGDRVVSKALSWMYDPPVKTFCRTTISD